MLVKLQSLFLVIFFDVIVGSIVGCNVGCVGSTVGVNVPDKMHSFNATIMNIIKAQNAMIPRC